MLIPAIHLRALTENERRGLIGYFRFMGVKVAVYEALRLIHGHDFDFEIIDGELTYSHFESDAVVYSSAELKRMALMSLY